MRAAVEERAVCALSRHSTTDFGPLCLRRRALWSSFAARSRSPGRGRKVRRSHLRPGRHPELQSALGCSSRPCPSPACSPGLLCRHLTSRHHPLLGWERLTTARQPGKPRKALDACTQVLGPVSLTLRDLAHQRWPWARVLHCRWGWPGRSAASTPYPTGQPQSDSPGATQFGSPYSQPSPWRGEASSRGSSLRAGAILAWFSRALGAVRGSLASIARRTRASRGMNAVTVNPAPAINTGARLGLVCSISRPR